MEATQCPFHPICDPQIMQMAVLLEIKSTLQLKSALILKLPAIQKETNEGEKQHCKVAPIRIAHSASKRVASSCPELASL